MNTFSDRLKEERLRLGFNQTDLAEIAGVRKGAQVNYEGGKRAPDATYMAAIAAAGVDVLYVLTGQRSQPVPAVELSREELALLDNYKHSDEVGRAAVRRLLSPDAQRKKA